MQDAGVEVIVLKLTDIDGFVIVKAPVVIEIVAAGMELDHSYWIVKD